MQFLGEWIKISVSTWWDWRTHIINQQAHIREVENPHARWEPWKVPGPSSLENLWNTRGGGALSPGSLECDCSRLVTFSVFLIDSCCIRSNDYYIIIKFLFTIVYQLNPRGHLVAISRVCGVYFLFIQGNPLDFLALGMGCLFITWLCVGLPKKTTFYGTDLCMLEVSWKWNISWWVWLSLGRLQIKFLIQKRSAISL